MNCLTNYYGSLLPTIARQASKVSYCLRVPFIFYFHVLLFYVIFSFKIIKRLNIHPNFSITYFSNKRVQKIMQYVQNVIMSRP